jgi:hypothetical protein
MSLQDLLNDAGGQTDTQKHRQSSASPTSLTSLLTTAKPISPVADDGEASQIAKLPQATIRAYNPETDGGNLPFNNVWTRIGQTVLPEFLQKELNIDETQRRDKPLTTAERVADTGNLLTIKLMNEKPENVSPLEYLRRGLSFGHDLDPTTSFSGYQKDVGVEDLPEPVTTKQKVAEAIGGLLTMSLAQPLIEAGIAGLIGKAATYIPAVGKAADTVSTAAKLRPWAVGYPLSIAKATAEGGLFGLIEKNKESLAHNVLTTAGEFAAFTALAFPIQQFFKPIIEQVGKATLDNPTAQKVLGNPDVLSKPVSQTIWFRNPKDPTQILKVTANGAEFTTTGSKELVAAGVKTENLPTMTSVQVEAFKENPSLYSSLKEWVGGKLPKKATIEFATPEEFAKAKPVEATMADGQKPSVVRDAVVKDEATYATKPTPEVETRIVEQRAALADYQQTYAQPAVETASIRVQVLPFDDGKWDVSVTAKAEDGKDGLAVPFGSTKLYPSRDAAAKAGLEEVNSWATEKGYDTLAKEAKQAASEPIGTAPSNPPESSRMAFTAPQSVEDLHAYLDDGAKRFGSRKAFLASDEYKAFTEAHGETAATLSGAPATEVKSELPVSDIPPALEAQATKDWEENIADKYQELADQIAELQTQAKAAGKAEAAKLQKQIVPLIEQQGKMEDDFLTKWRAEADKKPAEKTEPAAKEYRTIHQGGVEKMVTGEPVKIIDGVETFVHKGDGGFVVSEATTGRYLADSRTREAAIAKAKVNIEQVGVKKFKKLIEENKLPEPAKKKAPAKKEKANEYEQSPLNKEAAAWAKPIADMLAAKAHVEGRRDFFFVQTLQQLEEDYIAARDAAIGMIKPYVLRGDTIESLKAGQQSHAGKDFWAKIGGFVDGKKVPPSKIIVTHLDGKELDNPVILDLQKLMDVVKTESKPPVRIAKKTVEKKEAKKVLNLVARPAEMEGKTAPIISRNDMLILLRNNSEFAKNPVLTVEEKYAGMDKNEKVLVFKGEKTQFSIKASALGLVGDNLEIGQEINVAKGDLAKPSKEFRVMETNRATGSSKALASTGSDKIGNFEPVTAENAPAYNLKLHEQVQELIKKFAARIGEGYLPRGTAGVMYPKTGSIRIGGMNDLSTAAHEIAHFVDQKFGITKEITTPEGYREIPGMGIMPIYKKEERWLRKAISDIYINYYPGARREHPLPKRIVEGFATFVQKYMEMPQTMGEKYPKLVEAFFKPGGQYYVKDIEDLVADTRKIVDIYQGLEPLDKIGARVTHDTQEVDKEPLLSLGDRIRTEVVDNLFPLEKLAEKAGINMTPEDPSIWARAYNNSSAMVLTNINSDRGFWSFREGKFVKLHDYNWKTLVKQLESEKNGDAFNYWLIARDQHFNYQELNALKDKWEQLDAQLLRQEQGYTPAEGELPVTKAAVQEAGAAYKDLKGILDRNGFTEKEVTTAYEQNKDRFAKEGEMFDTLVREDLNFMHDTQVQLVDSETYTKLTSKEGYASLKRDFYDEVAGEMTDGSGNRKPGGVKASSLKQRSGSARAILPPIDSAIRNHAEMTKKGLKQIVYNRIGDIGIGAMFPDLFHVTELKAIPDGTGAIHFPQEKDPDIIMARRGYKRVPILTDRLIKRTVDELLNPQNMGYFEQLVVGASRLFTKGTTGIYAPFALSNYTIDQITATAQSTQKYVPLITPIKTLMKVLADRQDESEAAKYFMEYLVLGGERQTMIGWQDMSPRELERRIKGEVDGLTKVIDYANKGLDVLGLPSKWSEIATRATEYIQARMNGSEAIVALEQAGRVTAPFHHVGRLGGSNAGKMFVKSIPFFNPMLQVLDQAARSGFSKSPAARQRYWFVTAAVIASLVGSLFVINKKGTQEQKDLYKDLDPQMLTKYVFIPNPNGKTLLRIRVPDQMAVVGSIMNMAIADQIMNTKYDVGDYFDASTAWLPQQMQINKPAEALLSWIPQILKPGVEVAANIKDFPKVMPLESQSQQNKPAGLRFTEGTSPVAKWLGKEIGMSPIKIDYLLTGYFGRATGYLTAKPGVYNPASVVNQIYYFSSGRRVQDFYDLRQKNDELYNAYTHKLQTFPVGTPSKILRQRALITDTYDQLKLYSNIDPEKDPEKAQQLRQRILDSIDKVQAIKI